MKSDKYWENRAAERMVDYMGQAEKTAAEMSKAYDAVGKYISEETSKIYETFSKNISGAEAQRLLSKTSDKSVRNQLIDAVSKISDKETRDAMLAEINAPAYQWRLQRLEAVQREAKQMCEQLYNAEVKADTKCFTNLANEAYMRNIYDVQKGTGLAFNFSQISKEQINAILSRNWTGEHYSERIWANTQEVADTVKHELLSGMLSGKSNSKIADDIQMRFGVGASDARRLIRTESCYVANAAEMDSYAECDIERYRFVATLDNRTSYLCQDEDEKVYEVKDAVPGKNMPPLHPYCRSTTVMELSADVMKSLERRAKDPVTGETQKIPADMSYEEWKNGHKAQPAQAVAPSIRSSYMTLYNGADKYFKENGFNDWLNSLNFSEKSSIKAYAGGGSVYLNMNRYLRGEISLEEYAKKSLYNVETAEKRVRSIKSALDKFELNDDMQVLRVSDAVMYKSLNVGDTFKDNAFVSTTTDKSRIDPNTTVQMVIDVPKGKGRGAWVTPLAQNKDENEFLLNSGQEYEVYGKEIKDGVVYLKLRMKS